VTTIPLERELLAAARAGDEDAYLHLVEPHRAELQAHCYRMLGSVHDAEDALQDTLLRAWRGLARFEGRSSVRRWLYAIATNTSLDAAARRPKRVLPLDHRPAAGVGERPGDPLAEPIWVEPFHADQLGLEDGLASPDARYELRESVELAFVAALQHLPPRQRAVLILRDVLGFSAQEVAESLGTTVASANSALQRARTAAEERLPERSQQATLRELGDARISELVARYADAMERGDLDAIFALLTEDATWSMPPMPQWYRGREPLAYFLSEHALQQRWRHVPGRASAQVAVGCYAWDEARGAYPASVIDVLTLRRERIAAITAFVTTDIFRRFDVENATFDAAELFARFGLPLELR
jgi:RNA polymerase sigma-70 factor (ECF subfamily)